MQREGKYAGVVFKDLGGSVALVNVAIGNRDSDEASLSQQPGGRYGNVIEDAKP
jgi:hypothetical protein